MSLPTDAPDRRIDAGTAADLLETLVAISSPSGQERGAAAAMAEWMAARGFAAQVDAAGNAVGTRGRGPHEVLLLGHIDTFSGQLPVTRDGEWLTGRGTVDAKGPLCAFAAAAASLTIPAGWQVTVIGAVEEEAATSKGARHVLATRSAPAACIIGEPSSWDRVTLGYKGRLLADVTLRAPFAHSAGPAALPAERAVALWRRVEQTCAEYNADRGGPFARLIPSLRAINSRDAGAYGVVELSLGFRLPPGLTPDALATDLEALLSADHGAEVTCTFHGGEPAIRADKNSPLVRAFLPAIRAAGGRPRFVVKTGTSDMNVVGPAWGCPIAAYGPGDSSLDHTPEERINLAEYDTAIDVLIGTLTAYFAAQNTRQDALHPARLLDEETPRT